MRCATLVAGANGVSCLAPGARYTREHSAHSSQHSGRTAVRKVNVTR